MAEDGPYYRFEDFQKLTSKDPVDNKTATHIGDEEIARIQIEDTRRRLCDLTSDLMLQQRNLKKSNWTYTLTERLEWAEKSANGAAACNIYVKPSILLKGQANPRLVVLNESSDEVGCRLFATRTAFTKIDALIGRHSYTTTTETVNSKDQIVLEFSNHLKVSVPVVDPKLIIGWSATNSHISIISMCSGYGIVALDGTVLKYKGKKMHSTVVPLPVATDLHFTYKSTARVGCAIAKIVAIDNSVPIELKVSKDRSFGLKKY